MDYMSRNPRASTSHIFTPARCALILTLPYADLNIDWQKRAWSHIHNPKQGYVSLYARGRDYHKVMRQKMLKLMNDLALYLNPNLNQNSNQNAIAESTPDFTYRIVVDSAPLLEIELAHRAGLGVRGKHTLLLRREGGSLFFLGEILLSLDLPFDPPSPAAACGQCQKCIDVCPTKAIVAPYRLDARRCISYLTIENKAEIPLEFRRAIGTRIYGCDDCQLICPWNKFAHNLRDPDFNSRPQWQDAPLTTLCAWTEAEFLRYTEGSPIRRIGYKSWQRNLAVAAGNALLQLAPDDAKALRAILNSKLNETSANEFSAMVREHIQWALAEQ